MLLEWNERGPAMALPATVGLAKEFGELDPVDEDPAGFVTEREAYRRGWRWCECFSAREPDGEGGHVRVERLLPLRGEEFDFAIRALDDGPVFFEARVAALPSLVAFRRG